MRVGLLLLGLLLAACTQDDTAQTKSIAGLMPDLRFELRDDHGTRVSAEDYAGQVRLLFFGYTSCPDVCPLTLGRLSAVLHGLDASELERTTVLFVSVDPARDTPEKLQRYVQYFGSRIVGLTGDEPQLRTLSRRYRTTFGYGEKDDSGFYEVSHSSGVYVFDAAGRAQRLFRPADSVESMREDLRRVLSLDRSRPKRA